MSGNRKINLIPNQFLKFVFLIVAFLLCTIVNLCSCSIISPDWVFSNEDTTIQSIKDNEEYHPLSEKQDFFDWTLIHSVLINNRKNIIISPFSVKLLIAIIREAARSDTRYQLLQVLRDIPSGPSGYVWFYETQKSLKEKHTGYEFSMGTKYFYNNQLKPSDKFLELCSAIYGTENEKVNFGLATKVANIINNWSRNVTNGHVEKLVDEDSIKNYVALITNAVHFKGEWQNVFSTEDTRLHKFRINFNKDRLVPMMLKSDEFYFLDTPELNGVKILRMPYKGGKYAMTLLLPHNPDGLDEMLAKIQHGKIQELQKNMEKMFVFVAIPKFKIETITQYREILQKMNVTKIFSENAQLPDLGSSISEILQKAAITVNEEGTEVFMTTKVKIVTKGMLIAEFKATHPFVFFIEDETTGALLFAGKVVNPTL